VPVPRTRQVAVASEWIQAERQNLGLGPDQVQTYATELAQPGSATRIRIDMKPLPTSPMQYLPAAGAAYAAALVGCRLPTESEWMLAQRHAPKSQEPPNLRDPTWQKQHDHVRRTRNRGQGALDFDIFYPDEDAFRLPGTREGREATVEAGAPEDGWLWFAPGGGVASGLRHLRGNVAELVVRGGPSQPASTSVADVRAWVRGTPLGVIGGSAIGPPTAELDWTKAGAITDPARSWSDVGFRLAFSAPVHKEPTMAQRVGDVLKAYPDFCLLAR
jgi:hypothetical protein